jgi:hypothetical protein
LVLVASMAAFRWGPAPASTPLTHGSRLPIAMMERARTSRPHSPRDDRPTRAQRRILTVISFRFGAGSAPSHQSEEICCPNGWPAAGWCRCRRWELIGEPNSRARSRRNTRKSSVRTRPASFNSVDVPPLGPAGTCRIMTLSPRVGTARVGNRGSWHIRHHLPAGRMSPYSCLFCCAGF